MACDLTTGLPLDCRDSIGGVKNIYVTELANKDTLMASTEGLIDTFTLTTGKQFWVYEGIKQTSSATENIQTSTENGTVFYEQDVQFIINKQQYTTRNELKLLAQNRVMVIVEDRNGKFWLYGEMNGMELDPSSAATGAAMGDRNGYELNLKGFEEMPAQEVDSALIPTLIAPAV